MLDALRYVFDRGRLQLPNDLHVCNSAAGDMQLGHKPNHIRLQKSGHPEIPVASLLRMRAVQLLLAAKDIERCIGRTIYELCLSHIIGLYRVSVNDMMFSLDGIPVKRCGLCSSC